MGASGYTMTGMFSYADSLIGTGAITGASLNSFLTEVFFSVRGYKSHNIKGSLVLCGKMWVFLIASWVSKP